MASSKTIAALLGPTLMASAASIFLNLEAWPAMVERAFHDPGLIFVTGYPIFVAGLAIVHFHNQWTGGWPVVVTVLGWLIPNLSERDSLKKAPRFQSRHGRACPHRR